MDWRPVDPLTKKAVLIWQMEAATPRSPSRMAKLGAHINLLLVAALVTLTTIPCLAAAALPDNALLIPGSLPLDTDGNLVRLPAIPATLLGHFLCMS